MSEKEIKYHWANVIIFSSALVSIILNFINIALLDSEVLTVFFSLIYNLGFSWILISGIINKDIREFVIKSFQRFIKMIIPLAGGLAFISSIAIFGATLIFIVVFASIIMTIGLILLGIYLYVTSIIALKDAGYFQ